MLAQGVGGAGPLALPLAVTPLAKEAADLRLVGIEGERAPELLAGAGLVAAAEAGKAERGMGERVLRREAGRAAEVGFRAGAAALLQAIAAAEQPEPGLAGASIDRPVEQRQAAGRLP
jgi:hypothetical protein